MRKKQEYSVGQRKEARKSLRSYSVEDHRNAVKRLRELAEGAEPQSSYCGICRELSKTEYIGFDGYIYLSNVFVLMGLSKERRALAKDVADFIQKEFL